MSDYDAVHRAPQAATAADLFPAATPVSSRGHPRRAWAVVMAGPALAVADYHVLAGSHHATGARGPPRPGCAGPATTAPGSPRRR